MAFDYKKEYKEFYLPPRKPGIVTVPPMNFVSVQGRGDPNEPGGEYQAAMELLYGIAFTIKMSYKGSHKIDGYFEYVVPPLEGLWHQEGVDGVDYAHKECFEWTSMIRLPDFVTREVFDWAVQEATAKKKKDFSKVQFFHYDEGLCVQCMQVLMMPNRRRWSRWMLLRGNRVMRQILQGTAATTKFTSAIRAGQHRKN